MKKELICYCEAKVELDVPERIDLTANPETKAEILAGRFMSVRCGTCGKLLKPEFPVRIDGVGGSTTLYFIPELDRLAYMRNKLPYPVPETDRVVIGYEELLEKLRLADAELDDRVAEMIKYILYSKAVESAETEKEIRIFFNRRSDGTLVFHVHGLKEGEVGVLNVPETTVKKLTDTLPEKLEEEPFSRFLTGAYVSLNRYFSEVVE